MILDSHAHLVSDDFTRYPPTPLSGTLDRPLDDPMTAEKLLRLMDAEGIEHAVAVQRAHVYGYNNDYVCDAAERYPNRLVAVCCIDADAGSALERARHWLLQRGAAGLRLTEPAKGSGIGWFASPQAKAVWQLVDELGGSLCLHMYRWNRIETLLALPPLLTQFPQVAVVLDHASNLVVEAGSPDYGVDAALAALVRFPRVYQKFTTINFSKMTAQDIPLAPVVTRVVREFGAKRVMWGSDVAQSAGSYAELVAMAKVSLSELSATQRQAVLHGTAASVYGRKDSLNATDQQ
jgi:predicted TIM-barrel fold metal-dependent hydrolase